jgi:hypothetical protein
MPRGNAFACWNLVLGARSNVLRAFLYSTAQIRSQGCKHKCRGPILPKNSEIGYGRTGNLVGAVREVHTRATHTGVVKILELLDGLRDRADCAGNMAPQSGCRLACCRLSYELPAQCWQKQHCLTLTTHDEAAEKHAGSRKGGRVRTRADNLGAHPVRAAGVLILPPHVGWLLCASL